jgi:hypothetical protein
LVDGPTEVRGSPVSRAGLDQNRSGLADPVQVWLLATMARPDRDRLNYDRREPATPDDSASAGDAMLPAEASSWAAFRWSGDAVEDGDSLIDGAGRTLARPA